MQITSKADIENLKGNKYRIKELLDKFTQKQEIEQFHPCELDYNEMERYATLYLNKAEKITIQKDYLNQWHIYQQKSFTYCRYESENRIKSDMEREGLKPNGFKILSKKNIENWLTYSLEFYKRLEIVSNEYKTKVLDFLAKIETLKNDGCIFKPYGETGGILTKGEFKFIYNVQDNGHIEQKIHLTDYSNDIETFTRLASLK